VFRSLLQQLQVLLSSNTHYQFGSVPIRRNPNPNPSLTLNPKPNFGESGRHRQFSLLHYLATALRWLAQLIPGRAVRELQTSNFFVWDRWKGTSEVNFSVDCPADSMTDCLMAYYNVLLPQFLRMVQLLLSVTWCLLVNFASN